MTVDGPRTAKAAGSQATIEVRFRKSNIDSPEENRAARLVEDMEKAGLVSSMNGAGQRDILVPTRAE